MARFSEESAEHIANIERDLLRLETKPGDRALVENMMREAHTMKGAASMMGLDDIARLSHDFEDSLLTMTDCDSPDDEVSFESLFGMLDRIAQGLDAGRAPAGSDGAASDGPRASVVASGAATSDVPRAAAPSDTEAPTQAALPSRPSAEAMRSRRTDREAPSGAVAPRDVSERSAGADALQRESIRVEVSKLDELMNLAGELVIARTRLDERLRSVETLLADARGNESGLRLDRSAFENGNPANDATLEADEADRHNAAKRLGGLVDELRRDADGLSFTVSQVQNRVMETRMLPLQVVFDRFPRAVRDLAREQGKSARILITGEDTELDKTVLEQIRDPLMHILRNAVAHGLESPLEREKQGKSATGTIELRAYCRGSQVIIEIEDDGRGIDSEAVMAAAVEAGIVSETDAGRLTEAQTYDLLFEPGFTTQGAVSQLSGRGVGMDVVKEDVTRLKGQIEVSSVSGKWTRFALSLPLTLAITSVLIVKVGGSDFALPLDSIEETLRVGADEIKRIQGRQAVCIRDEIIPLVSLREALKLGGAGKDTEERGLPAVVVRAGGAKLVLVADGLGGRLDVVAKSLGSHLVRVKHIAGATLSGSGRVVPILDVPSIVRDASAVCSPATGGAAPEQTQQRRGAVLLVEDSAITRDLERSILRAANYEVDVAQDGVEGLGMLAQREYALVITDVSMPRMDGMEMIRRMRSESRYADVPVIVVSSKDTAEERLQGMEAGASAYLGKKSFDQAQLLETVQRLIG
ncbi:MAG: hybrid sensor histidine kinase/response regulator [Candidatus Eisenbacteria bacterium]